MTRETHVTLLGQLTLACARHNLPQARAVANEIAEGRHGRGMFARRARAREARWLVETELASR